MNIVVSLAVESVINKRSIMSGMQVGVCVVGLALTLTGCSGHNDDNQCYSTNFFAPNNLAPLQSTAQLVANDDSNNDDSSDPARTTSVPIDGGTGGQGGVGDLRDRLEDRGLFGNGGNGGSN